MYPLGIGLPHTPHPTPQLKVGKIDVFVSCVTVLLLCDLYVTIIRPVVMTSTTQATQSIHKNPELSSNLIKYPLTSIFIFYRLKRPSWTLKWALLEMTPLDRA